MKHTDSMSEICLRWLLKKNQINYVTDILMAVPREFWTVEKSGEIRLKSAEGGGRDAVSEGREIQRTA